MGSFARKNSPAYVTHRPGCFILPHYGMRIMHHTVFVKTYSDFLS